MKTRFIIVGGYPHKAADEGKAFCEEVVRGFHNPVKVLSCLFARPIENWNIAFAQDREFFTKHLFNIEIDIQLAKPKTFTEQVRWANLIYIRGGTSTHALIALLKQSGEWQKELIGKTVAGSSAGAEAMATHYYNIDDLKLDSGLGLVPVKVIVHWRSDYNAPNVDWDKAYSELQNYKESLPILTLAEGQFEVYEK